MSAGRWVAWLAGVWTGVLVAIGGIAAPAAFAVAPRQVAGLIGGRMFAMEAYAGLAVAVALVLILRRRARAAAAAGAGSVLSADLLLALGALFCTVLGYFALQPMMAPARAGQAAVSFATLHAISSVFFMGKTVLVAILAWRLAPR